jgi:hypothetical protein
MKFKLTALILALTLVSWAQTTPQPSTTPDGGAPQAKAACSCCGKKGNAAEGQSCCRHDKMANGEKATPCCSGDAASACCNSKETKSCMKDDKNKTASAASGDCCGNHEKSCCASHQQGDKTAMNCGDDKQCGEHCARASAGASK